MDAAKRLRLAPQVIEDVCQRHAALQPAYLALLRRLSEPSPSTPQPEVQRPSADLSGNQPTGPTFAQLNPSDPSMRIRTSEFHPVEASLPNDVLICAPTLSRRRSRKRHGKQALKPYVTCYKLVDGVLHPTRDFTGAVERDDISERLISLGYKRQMHSGRLSSESGRLTVWKSSDPDLPPFYVEVAGATHALAVLVATDFVQLADTLRHLSSLIELFSSGAAGTNVELASSSPGSGNKPNFCQ